MAETALPRAASVVLLRETPGRDEPSPFETYMLRRPDEARFAPGAYIFPGGVLEEQDRACAAAIPALVDGPAGAALHARMADPAAGPFASPDTLTSAATFACAARELFEEAGVLVARDRGGAPVVMTDPAHWGRLREELLAGRLTFDRLLREEGLVLSPDDLMLFSHWITPERLPIRFDTWFFLATLPPGQEAGHWEGEIADGLWITPAEGLARHARGEFPMIPVQTRHLERFAGFDSLGALLDFARRKPVPAVLPAAAPGSGGQEVALPEEIARCW